MKSSNYAMVYTSPISIPATQMDVHSVSLWEKVKLLFKKTLYFDSRERPRTQIEHRLNRLVDEKVVKYKVINRRIYILDMWKPFIPKGYYCRCTTDFIDKIMEKIKRI